jgi:DNA polymerase III subunit delta
LERVRAEAGTDPLSEVVLDTSAGAAEIIEALDTPSLLGGRRLVVILGAHELKKDQLEAVQKYLESPSPHSILVVVSSGRSKLAAAAKKVGVTINQDAPRGRALAKWVRDRAREHRLKVDDRTAWALIDSVGTNLRDLDGGLAQLATGLGGNSTVAVADVRRAFPRLADERIYVFTDAVGERKLAPAMGALRRLLQQGDEPLMVFGALTSHMRRVLVARGSGATGGVKAVGDVLGLPDWRAERLYRQARTYREEELIRVMEVLAETDVEMKGGDLPPEIALERAVVQIVDGP